MAAADDRLAVQRQEQQGVISRGCSGFGLGEFARLPERGGVVVFAGG
jgi:hypothetical protein